MITETAIHGSFEAENRSRSHNLGSQIGNTPLLRLCRVTRDLPVGVEVFVKAEHLNPGGSVKDRPALAMILDGERSGHLYPGKIILDATSGNTGIAMALMAKLFGIEIELVMPSSSTRERVLTMEAFGAKVTLLESIETIEQPSRLQAWLVTTAKRKTWRTVGRAKALRPFASEEGGDADEMYDLAYEGLLPDEALTRLEEQHLVRASLGELGERCRTLLQMLFYAAETPPYSEIAAALGTSEGSIGPTRARCLKKLLDALKKKGFS